MTNDLRLGLRRRVAHPHQSLCASAVAHRHRGGVPEQPARGPLALAAGLTVSFAVLGVSVTAFGHLVSVDSEAVNRVAAVMMMGVRRGAARPESPDGAGDAGRALAREPRELANRHSREHGNRRAVRSGRPARGGLVAVRRSDPRRRHRPRRERRGTRPGGGHDAGVRGRRVHGADGAGLRVEAGGERTSRAARRMDAVGEAGHGRDAARGGGSRSCSTSTA